MDIKDFISLTLKQIEEALSDCSNQDMEYYIDNHSSKGVHFNLAVTNTSSEKLGKGKSASIQIKVIEAGLGKNNEQVLSSETVSRIEFNVKNIDHAKNKREAANFVNM